MRQAGQGGDHRPVARVDDGAICHTTVVVVEVGV